MRAIVYDTEKDAFAAIAIEDEHRGYPVTERGERVGGGRHVETITTRTHALPIETDDGRWAVPHAALIEPALAHLSPVEAAPKRADPRTVAGGAKPSVVRVVDAVRVPR